MGKRESWEKARGVCTSNSYPQVCPCGFWSDPVKECTCSASAIARYQKRISGPLLDYEKLADKRQVETSETVRKRVQAARERQLARFKETKCTCNAEMGSAEVRDFCTVEPAAEKLVSVTTKVIYGDPDEVKKILGEHTAYVERTNLTSRQMNGRLVRKTLSFSKELRFLKAASVLEDALYNFTRPRKHITHCIAKPFKTRVLATKDTCYGCSNHGSYLDCQGAFDCRTRSTSYTHLMGRLSTRLTEIFVDGHTC